MTAFLLQPEMLEFSLLFQHYFAEPVVEIYRRTGTRIAFDQRRPGTLTEHHQVTRLGDDRIFQTQGQV